ncbi:hypothetical protein FLA_0217 [Filimonas lacunae]|nr:hypothetical protein FLA_0217 [Filimonas lacunae]
MINMRKCFFCCLVLTFFLQCCNVVKAKPPRPVWTSVQANAWYAKQPWIVGSNYLPATAINQLEMWQAETFDPSRIDTELGWAQSLGMNTMRVFLHDIVFQLDSAGLMTRIDRFLRIADKHKIRVLFVLFDSVWDPFPKEGEQRKPAPHVHNSGWVQSPGKKILMDSTQHYRMERYVRGVIQKFATDERILGWDIWNEPDNTNDGDYAKNDVPDKAEVVLPLLKKAFLWARQANPQQPITAGIWDGNWEVGDSLRPMEKLMIEESDIISFHNYSSADVFRQKMEQLQRYHKPLICTEYMARPRGSTFAALLPIMKENHVGAINWGFVDGKSQTKFPWDSWRKSYGDEPPVWFHDVFRTNGTPYDEQEATLIKQLTGLTKK